MVWLLTKEHRVPESALAVEAFGESHAQFADDAPESQRQQDRRVLVARTW